MVDILNDYTKDCVYFSFTFIYTINVLFLFILYFNIPFSKDPYLTILLG